MAAVPVSELFLSHTYTQTFVNYMPFLASALLPSNMCPVFNLPLSVGDHGSYLQECNDKSG